VRALFLISSLALSALCSRTSPGIRVLLGWGDVNPDKPDEDGRTPLSQAASCGHEGVVKLLLGRDNVDPDRPDGDGHPPLWWAAKNGHEGVVALLQPQRFSVNGAA